MTINLETKVNQYYSLLNSFFNDSNSLDSTKNVELEVSENPLIDAWRDVEARKLIKKLLYNGVFKADNSLADLFVEEIERCILSEDYDNVFHNLRRMYEESFVSFEFKNNFIIDEEERIGRRVEQITKTLERPSSLVDIGCGDGLIMKALAEQWRLGKESVVGFDVEDRMSQESGFSFIDANSPLLDNLSCQLCTTLMVLHHEEKPEELVKKAYRMLEPGGTLFIRDLDVLGESEVLFHTALDNLYYQVFNNLPGIPVPANYQCAEYWKNLCVGIGFKVEKILFPEPDSPIKPFHLVLKK